MLHTGIDKREQESCSLQDPFVVVRAILRIPPCISLAKIVVGTASSRRRTGFDFELVWIQKLTFPRRYPNKVPVMMVDEKLDVVFGLYVL